MADGPSVGYATLQVIPSMRGAQAALAGQIAGPASAVGATAGRQMGGSLVGTLGGVLKAGLGGALVAGGVLVGLDRLASSFDDAFDTIRVGTGAVGDDLEGLKDTFRDVFSSVPTDMGLASTAVADLNTRLGLTGDPLADISRQFLELSRVTGSDLTGNIESVTRVFGDWGVATADQGSTLDALFRGSQATGIGVDRLAQQLVQFGAPLRQMGFDLQTSAGLLAKFEQEGVNAELVMGSLRIALGKFAREGKDPVEALDDIIERIQNAGSAGEANSIALEVFGARAGADMAAAIREGRFELGNLFDTISSGNETVLQAAEDTNDWRESWEIIKNRVLVGLEPIAERVFTAIGAGLDWVSPRAEIFAGWFSEHVAPALAAAWEAGRLLVADVFDAIGNWWESNGGTVIGGLQTIGSTITDTLLPALGDFVGWIGENQFIVDALITAIGVGLVAALGAYTYSALAAGAATLVAFAPYIAAAALVGGLTAATDRLIEQFRDPLNSALQGVIDVGAGVLDFFRQLRNLIEPLVDFVGYLVENLGKIKIPGTGGGFNPLDIITAPFGLPGAVLGGILGRAHGGPALAGVPYIVGEHRPELFVPDVDGYVLPSVPSGYGTTRPPSGGMVVQLNVNNPVPEPASESILKAGRRMAALL